MRDLIVNGPDNPAAIVLKLAQIVVGYLKTRNMGVSQPVLALKQPIVPMQMNNAVLFPEFRLTKGCEFSIPSSAQDEFRPTFLVHHVLIRIPGAERYVGYFCRRHELGFRLKTSNNLSAAERFVKVKFPNLFGCFNGYTVGFLRCSMYQWP